MMHPDTAIRFISEQVGVGVVATQNIPCGTILWAPDPLDQYLDQNQIQDLPRVAYDSSIRYMYRNVQGRYVLLWDHAKYVNHSFSPNSMPTPFGCEMALQDIAAGEEITGDYGMLNIIEDFEPVPEGGLTDRKVVRGDDLVHHYAAWDTRLQQALPHVTQVHQPLWSLLSIDQQTNLKETVLKGLAPRSVLELYYPS